MTGQVCISRKTMQNLVSMTCQQHNITPEEFFSKRRIPQYVNARRVVAKELAMQGYSYAEIGRKLKLHHTTILYLMRGVDLTPPSRIIPIPDLSGEWAI